MFEVENIMSVLRSLYKIFAYIYMLISIHMKFDKLTRHEHYDWGADKFLDILAAFLHFSWYTQSQ